MQCRLARPYTCTGTRRTRRGKIPIREFEEFVTTSSVEEVGGLLFLHGPPTTRKRFSALPSLVSFVMHSPSRLVGRLPRPMGPLASVNRLRPLQVSAGQSFLLTRFAQPLQTRTQHARLFASGILYF